MADLFYDTLVLLGRPVFFVSSAPLVLGSHHTRLPGPYLLAANHSSPYDIPILMRHCARRIDFVSITEVFRNPFVAWLYGGMNAFPLDRSRRDVGAARTIVDRLRAGRVVGIFPEGGFRTGASAVINGGGIRPGIGRLAQIAGNVPILPAAILDSSRFSRPAAWLPLRRTRYGIAFGPPLPTAGRDPASIEADLIACIRQLHANLAGQVSASAEAKNRAAGKKS